MGKPDAQLQPQKQYGKVLQDDLGNYIIGRNNNSYNNFMNAFAATLPTSLQTLDHSKHFRQDELIEIQEL